MKTKNGLLYVLNKTNLDSYLKTNDDEKFNYNRRKLIDDSEDHTSVKIKNILIVFDGFVNFFDNINSTLYGYW